MSSSKTSVWLSLEDLDNDLCEFSEIAVSQDDICEPPLATIVQYRAQMSANHNSSVFDTHMPYEDVTYVTSGRGRGGFSKFYRPGMPVNDSDRDDMVYRKIREVSGIGYSNELIKKSMRAKLGKMSDREFSDVPSSSEETVSRTNGFTTDRPTANSRSSTPLDPTPHESASLTSAANANKPEIKESPPPPLSVMLKRAKAARNQSPRAEVQAVTESYAKMAIEPPNVREQLKTPTKAEKRRESPKVGAGSSSESSQFSARNSSSTPTSETSYNTAGSGVEHVWYNKPSQLKEMSSSSSNSSYGDEPLPPLPLLWKNKSQSGKIFTKGWRKGYDPRKSDFNINSKKDFPAL